MIKRFSVIFTIAALGFGCAHEPSTNTSVTPAGEAKYSPTWSPKVDNMKGRNPSSTTQTNQYMVEGQSINLSSCGGHDGVATYTRNYDGRLIMAVRNIECAAWTSPVVGFNSQELNNGTDPRQHWGDLPIDDNSPGYHTIYVGSRNYIENYISKGKTPPSNIKGDVIQYYIPAKLTTLDLTWDGTSGTRFLSSCGGSVEAKITPDRSVALIFRNVVKCSGFELMSNDGQPLDYSKGLDDQGDFFGGSRSIPRKYVDLGHNGVYARVFRVGGGEDRLLIHFIGAP